MAWFKKRTRDEPSPESVNDLDVVTRIAREHLPPDVAERWLTLLRPALQLRPARAGEPVVARLGGTPLLPADVPWPVWEGHGPLGYVGELYCGAIDQAALDIRLPASGRLLFFFFDGSYDDAESVVGFWDPPSLAGAQVRYVPDGAAAVPRPAPERVEVWGEAAMAARPVVTDPGREHPVLREAFGATGDAGDWSEHPVVGDAFTEALAERHAGTVHQIGGYAEPVQGPVEYEVAEAALGGAKAGGAVEAEARRWTLLLQVDSDAALGLEWGDWGMLYWLARTDELDGTPPRTSFTWQCG